MDFFNMVSLTFKFCFKIYFMNVPLSKIYKEITSRRKELCYW